MKPTMLLGMVCGALVFAAGAVAQLPPGFPAGKKLELPLGGAQPDPSKLDPTKLLAGAGPLAELAKSLGATDPQQVAADLQAAIRGVSLYPPRTRTAILNLAKYSNTYPKLLAELKGVRSKPAAEIDRYLTSNQFPDELQQSAAIVLIDAPETIDKMLERQPMVALVGKAYETPPGKEVIETVLAVFHEQTAQTQAASTDAWAEQLSSNPQLLEQYLQMLAAYAQQAQQAQSGSGTDSGTGTSSTGTGSSGTGDSTDSSGSYDPYGYGTTASSDGYSVSDVPSEEVINYALAYGYQYGEVAAALINQYANQDNLDDYQQAVGNWWNENGQNIPQDVYNQHKDYYDSLKQVSQFDKLAREQGATSAAQRSELLRRNSEQFPGASRMANRPGGAGSKGPFSKEAGSKGKQPGGEGPFSKLSKAGNKGPAGGDKKGPGSTPFTKGSASPFSDLSKATPRNQRPPQSPSMQGGPFSALAGGKQPPKGGPAGGGAPKSPFSNLAGGKAPPMQVQRGQPSFGNQLGRAQSFHGAAWSGPQMGGGGFPGGGFPGGKGGGFPGGGGFGPKGGGGPPGGGGFKK